MSELRDYINSNNFNSFDELRSELLNKNLDIRENDQLCLIKYDRKNTRLLYYYRNNVCTIFSYMFYMFII